MPTPTGKTCRRFRRCPEVESLPARALHRASCQPIRAALTEPPSCPCPDRFERLVLESSLPACKIGFPRQYDYAGLVRISPGMLREIRSSTTLNRKTSTKTK